HDTFENDTYENGEHANSTPVSAVSRISTAEILETAEVSSYFSIPLLTLSFCDLFNWVIKCLWCLSVPAGVQNPHEAFFTLIPIKEEPKELQFKQESIQANPVIKEESRDGAEAENSSDTDDSADWTPSAGSPTPQTHTEQLQGSVLESIVSGDGGADKRHKCSHCWKKFLTKFNLKRHLRTHTGVKPFKFSVCAMSFLHNSYLKTHMRTHTGEKPFRYSVCGMRFSQNSYLKKHKRIHAEEKQFKCSVCAMNFSHNSVLKTHMRVHTGEKPFKCSVCAKSFSQNSHLKNHVRTHGRENIQVYSVWKELFTTFLLEKTQKEKPFQCSVCAMSYSHNSSMKRHMRTHRGEEPM
uniref:C2H2-type domain-containing protein n=1 Tax=Neogobius melanostomus TaxID=47308 RepID=A0A8C6TX22_9GOBI